MDCSKPSPMLQAFLAQQPNIKENIVNYQEENYQKALLQLAKSQRFSDHMNIPTQLKDGQLDNVNYPRLKSWASGFNRMLLPETLSRKISTDFQTEEHPSTGVL